MLAVSGPGREKGRGCQAWGHGAWTRARPMERKQLWIRLEDRNEGRVQDESEQPLFPLPGQLFFREVLAPIVAH